MATNADSNSLTWSAQLSVTPPIRTPKLPGDKIILPQSALEQLLAAAPVVEDIRSANINHVPGFDPFNPYTFAAEARARAALASTHRQPQLPHPLTFRIVNPQNGRIVYAGIREFSAKDGEVSLSSFVRHSLGLEDGNFLPGADGGAADMPEVNDINDVSQSHEDMFPTVTVHAKQLPKGTYVRLRPLEAGYDPEDWKALLERHLRDNFTTLTTGELLTVAGGRHGDFRFLVDKVLPEGDGICIVDTDLEVDIEPLNEEQARETLRRRLEKTSRAPGTTEGSSLGGPISLGQEILGQVRRGEYVDYELREWDREAGLDISLDAADGADIDLLISPFSSRQRARPRDDEHVFGDLSTRSPKRLKLQSTNIELVDAEALYISVYAFPVSKDSEGSNRDQKVPLQYNLRVTKAFEAAEKETDEISISHDPEEVQCNNCHQWVPKRTLFLHENFCFRNNTFCPKCKNVFQKASAEWKNHWHCPDDDSYGNDSWSKTKHDIVSHTSYSCASCQFVAPSLPGLANHRTTTCPGKLILCQFCYLVVPQQGDSDPDVTDPEVLLSGLTPHELIDGGRTTECHLCNKIIRLRDMTTHLRHHDLERLSRPPPAICKNENCSRTLLGSSNKTTNDSLGLCGICFGPLYADTHDPEGKALRRRIERRYLSQMLTGCGKPWCRNRYCKTGQTQATSPTTNFPSGSKEILDIVRPLVDAIAVKPGVTNTAPFYFCTDEASQQRRVLAEMIAAEGVYDIEWCVAGVEAAAGDLDKARDWLKGWAPRKGEITTV
jgi:hypothetical protein